MRPFPLVLVELGNMEEDITCSLSKANDSATRSNEGQGETVADGGRKPEIKETSQRIRGSGCAEPAKLFLARMQQGFPTLLK